MFALALAVILSGGVSTIHAKPLQVVQICLVGLASGQIQCFGTYFSAPDYIDCTDSPAPPIGHPDRGSGVIRWGSLFGGEFEQAGSAMYEWSGWQVIAGSTVRAILGVDEDRVFGDGMDRTCTAGRF